MSGSVPNVTQEIPGSRNIFTATGDVFVTAPPVALTLTDSWIREDLKALSRKVKSFWIEGVLKASIQKRATLSLGKTLRPEAVDHPWGSVLTLPDQADQALPPETRIIDVFDQSGSAILILGYPGSGKTVTLLELARQLIARVEQDDYMGMPIPVIFNLSSWGRRHQSLDSWLLWELRTKYQTPRRRSEPWLENNRILPLLDGLDEVKQAGRGPCIEAINQFNEHYGLAGLAVCCRLEEYTELPVRLQLNAAVNLVPLSVKHITDYLSDLGSKVADLRKAISDDKALLQLARSPLMLNILVLAYQDVPYETIIKQSKGSIEERKAKLLDTYVDRMFRQRY